MRGWLASAMLLSSVVAGSAQERPAELRFSLWLPAMHPLTQTVTKEWIPSIESASGGTLKINLFPSEQIGKAFDHYDMARDGIADITFVNPGYQPGRFPIFSAAELPFVIKDSIGGSRAVDQWYRKYAEKEMKDVKVCMSFVHAPGALHMARTKVTKPEQMKGMKVRPAQATVASFMTSLGATNVQASAVEARDVIEKGVADGLTFPWGSVLLFKIDNAVKYHLDVPMYVTPLVFAINKSKFNSLSEKQKKALESHCNADWGVRLVTPWTKFEEGGRDKMRTLPGHDVYGLSDAEIESWKVAAKPVTDRWSASVKKVGADPKVVMDELQAVLKKNDALY